MTTYVNPLWGITELRGVIPVCSVMKFSNNFILLLCGFFVKLFHLAEIFIIRHTTGERPRHRVMCTRKQEPVRGVDEA